MAVALMADEVTAGRTATAAAVSREPEPEPEPEREPELFPPLTGAREMRLAGSSLPRHSLQPHQHSCRVRQCSPGLAPSSMVVFGSIGVVVLPIPLRRRVDGREMVQM
jgi:hypothetical protein